MDEPFGVTHFIVVAGGFGRGQVVRNGLTLNHFGGGSLELNHFEENGLMLNHTLYGCTLLGCIV